MTFLIHTAMRVKPSICLLMIVILLSGCVTTRTISGRLAYRQSGAPARQTRLRLEYSQNYPSFYAMFGNPLPIVEAATTTDDDGRFVLTTNNKHLLRIQPIAQKEVDIIAVELKDTMLRRSPDGSSMPNVIVGRTRVEP
jgi:hypothetical protein